MIVYRLGTIKHPVWSGVGAARLGGRWNKAGLPAIYAAGALSLAMLERLAQDVPMDDTLVVAANVPADLTVEDAFIAPPWGWSEKDRSVARRYGSEWLLSRRTAVLRVPSVVVPRECNYVVNPDHPMAASITTSAPESLLWDDRLFATRQA